MKGLTLIPLNVYVKYAKIKLAFGIGRGKKKLDKREKIKKRELQREMERELKTRGWQDSIEVIIKIRQVQPENLVKLFQNLYKCQLI